MDDTMNESGCDCGADYRRPRVRPHDPHCGTITYVKGEPDGLVARYLAGDRAITVIGGASSSDLWA